jgi:uncharacterized lipoprotein YajG
MSLFDPPWYKRVSQIVRRHLWTILFAVFMAAAVWMLVGCASTEVTPAENASKVSQTDSPPSKRVKLTIGGENVPVPNGSKTQPDRR